jgi:hypothetical protein
MEENNNNNNENKKLNFWQRLKLWQKIVLVLVVLAIIGGIFGANSDEDNDSKYGSIVNIVRHGHFDAYPDVSINTAFRNFFSNPKWEYFKSEYDEDIVEFEGGATLDNKPVTVEMQFIVNKDSGRFEVMWLGVNGVGQPDAELYDWIEVAYEHYYTNN